MPPPTGAELRQILGSAPQRARQSMTFAGSRSTPSQALVIYRRLTAERDRLVQEGRTLTPDQAQHIEQAERQLGQVMMDFLPEPTTPELVLESDPTRDLTRTPTAEQLRLFASSRITEPPFDTPERQALEDSRIHAIDDLLHGQRRPIAQASPSDVARSSRAQLQALLNHIRGSLRPSGALAADEQARQAESRRRNKALLIIWTRNTGVLLGTIPDRYQINGSKDKGGWPCAGFRGPRHFCERRRHPDEDSIRENSRSDAWLPP